jgi:serine/threonine protein kinase
VQRIAGRPYCFHVESPLARRGSVCARLLRNVGPFRLLQPVGQGSFGEVYRAWDLALEREVALKLLVRGVASDDVAYKAHA